MAGSRIKAAADFSAIILDFFSFSRGLCDNYFGETCYSGSCKKLSIPPLFFMKISPLKIFIKAEAVRIFPGGFCHVSRFSESLTKRNTGGNIPI